MRDGWRGRSEDTMHDPEGHTEQLLARPSDPTTPEDEAAIGEAVGSSHYENSYSAQREVEMYQ